MRIDHVLENVSRGAIILGLIVFSLSFGFTAPTVSRAQAVVINEIRIDQPSGDTDEYFELAGTPGTSLTGLTYLVIGDGAGGSGVIEEITDLTGQTIPASGYFVAAEATFSSTLGTADLITDLNFENSDNVTHMLVNNFTGALNDDLDTDDDGVLDTMPWTTIEDCVALLDDVYPPAGGEYVYCATQIGPDGGFPPAHVYRCPSPPWVMGEYEFVGWDTPGAANNCTTAVSVAALDTSSGSLSVMAIPMGLGLVAMLTGGGYLALRRRRK